MKARIERGIPIFLAAFLLCSACTKTSPTYPTPKQSHLSKEVISPNGLALLLPSDFHRRFGAVVTEFEHRFEPKGRQVFPVYVEINDVGDLPTDVRQGLGHRQTYWLRIEKDAVHIIGSDAPGALHGPTTLERLFSESRGRLPLGTILDWPDHDIRALHIVIRKVLSKVMMGFIRKARMQHFNVLILQLADGVSLPSMQLIARKDAWSPEEYSEIVRYAKENGMAVVPEIKLLTHQEKLLKDTRPDLMFNPSTYDPRQPETYEFFYKMLAEVISLTEPRFVHIGHDEVSGVPELPPELFLQDITRIHNFLKKRGIRTWMWGDMLLVGAAGVS